MKKKRNVIDKIARVNYSIFIVTRVNNENVNKRKKIERRKLKDNIDNTTKIKKGRGYFGSVVKSKSYFQSVYEQYGVE